MLVQEAHVKEKSVLVLSGWYYLSYLAASAAVVAAASPEDKLTVRAISMAALAPTLETLGPQFDEILILGVGLEKSLTRLATAVEALQQKGIRVIWISSRPQPNPWLVELQMRNLKGFDSIFVSEDSLVSAVAQYFPTASSKIFNFFYLYEDAQRGEGSYASDYSELQEAAGFCQRTRNDCELFEVVVRALAKHQPPNQWEKCLTDAVRDYRNYGYREFLGTSPATARIRSEIHQAAGFDGRVMILGASGTGKETIALQIHANSARRHHEFIAFNCTSLTLDLLEDRFFGHEKGAFTGADTERQGLFERADGGTLFLDEIAELPLPAQALLLRVLEEGRLTRLGGHKEIPVNVRLITATNRNLFKLVREKKFRLDLFFRLNTFIVEVPPLVERLEDVAEIAKDWWYTHHKEYLKDESLAALKTYNYPGNVRELVNVLERASLAGQDSIPELMKRQCCYGAQLFCAENGAEVYPDNLEAAKAFHIRTVYQKNGCNQARAAKALGIAVNTLKKYLAVNQETSLDDSEPNRDS